MVKSLEGNSKHVKPCLFQVVIGRRGMKHERPLEGEKHHFLCVSWLSKSKKNVTMKVRYKGARKIHKQRHETKKIARPKNEAAIMARIHGD